MLSGDWFRGADDEADMSVDSVSALESMDTDGEDAATVGEDAATVEMVSVSGAKSDVGSHWLLVGAVASGINRQKIGSPTDTLITGAPLTPRSINDGVELLRLFNCWS